MSLVSSDQYRGKATAGEFQKQKIALINKRRSYQKQVEVRDSKDELKLEIRLSFMG